MYDIVQRSPHFSASLVPARWIARFCGRCSRHSANYWSKTVPPVFTGFSWTRLSCLIRSVLSYSSTLSRSIKTKPTDCCSKLGATESFGFGLTPLLRWKSNGVEEVAKSPTCYRPNQGDKTQTHPG